MKATVIHGPGDIRLEDVPDPVIRRPTDAVVRITAACVCGSDLWAYRGIQKTREPHRIGHELVGVVQEVGSEVSTVRAGDFVISPFAFSDNTCVNCRNGVQTSCLHGAYWGTDDEFGEFVDGAQGEFARIPMADGTLVATPDQPSEDQLPALLTLSDVMATGHHAAVSARVGRGSTVVVVDRAVPVLARHADRQVGHPVAVEVAPHRRRGRARRRREHRRDPHQHRHREKSPHTGGRPDHPADQQFPGCENRPGHDLPADPVLLGRPA